MSGFIFCLDGSVMFGAAWCCLVPSCQLESGSSKQVTARQITSKPICPFVNTFWEGDHSLMALMMGVNLNIEAEVVTLTQMRVPKRETSKPLKPKSKRFKVLPAPETEEDETEVSESEFSEIE